jgi:hypothetical protein
MRNKSHHTGVSTFASRTSLSTGQSLQKSFHLSHADKIELKKISSPPENKKYATAQADPTQTMTVKLNGDNGLQGRTTEHQLPTAVAVAQPLSKKLLTKRETDRMSRFLFLVWEDVPAYRQAG